MTSDSLPQNTWYDVYAFTSPDCPPLRPVSGYQLERWRPTLASPRNSWVSTRYLAWSAALWTGVFRNRDYWIYSQMSDQDVAHYSCVVPTWFRWPFMRNEDLQVSNTWTAPEHRGRGLARSCLAQIVTDLGRGRSIWYVTRPENIASVRVCEAVGFRRMGRAERVSRLHSRLLGTLQLEGNG